MQAALDELVTLLALEPIEVNIFRGRSPDENRQRVFGGQVAGQALVAAARTVDDTSPARPLAARLLPAPRRPDGADPVRGRPPARRPQLHDPPRRRHPARAGDLQPAGQLPRPRAGPGPPDDDAARAARPGVAARLAHPDGAVQGPDGRVVRPPAPDRRPLHRRRPDEPQGRPVRRAAGLAAGRRASARRPGRPRLHRDLRQRHVAARHHRPAVRAGLGQPGDADGEPRPRDVVPPRRSGPTSGCSTTSTPCRPGSARGLAGGALFAGRRPPRRERRAGGPGPGGPVDEAPLRRRRASCWRSSRWRAATTTTPTPTTPSPRRRAAAPATAPAATAAATSATVAHRPRRRPATSAAATTAPTATDGDAPAAAMTGQRAGGLVHRDRLVRPPRGPRLARRRRGAVRRRAGRHGRSAWLGDEHDDRARRRRTSRRRRRAGPARPGVRPGRARSPTSTTPTSPATRRSPSTPSTTTARSAPATTPAPLLRHRAALRQPQRRRPHVRARRPALHRDGRRGVGRRPGAAGHEPGGAARQDAAHRPAPSGGRPLHGAAGQPVRRRRRRRPEIWASGLRNPWRFSFDRATGDLWIADVGQNAIEEVDVAPATGGVDAGKGQYFGWSALEGNAPLQRRRVDGRIRAAVRDLHARRPGCSVSGGVRARGAAVPDLVGWYVYGDYCAGAGLGPRGARRGRRRWRPAARSTSASCRRSRRSSTGPTGEVYVLSQQGPIVRLDPRRD